MKSSGKSETFGRYLESLIDRARDEARDIGSAGVEAEHLLLAIAAGADSLSRSVLNSAGLDHDSVRAALDAEFAHSLRGVGIDDLTRELPPPTPSVERPSQLGASVKLALERGTAAAVRGKELRPAHVLLGIVRAPVGTVPRALELAGISRTDLEARLVTALAAQGHGHER